MLDIAYWITQAFLAIGALCAVYRVYRGPSVLDRVMSVDVILIIVASVMLVDMTYRDHQDYLLFVVVTAVIGFLGAVAIARYIALRPPQPEPSAPETSELATVDSQGEDLTSSPDEWFAKLTQSGFEPAGEPREQNPSQPAKKNEGTL